MKILLFFTFILLDILIILLLDILYTTFIKPTYKENPDDLLSDLLPDNSSVDTTFWNRKDFQ